MSEHRVREDPLEPLVDVLAFYAATRNYGFIDRLAGSLNETTAFEAVIDALRDFYSQCLDREDKCVRDVQCPEVDKTALERAVDEFKRRIRGKPGDVIVKETRNIALAALARKPRMMERRC